MFRWEGGAAFMILELGSILTDYVRQLSFLCISHFPGKGSYTWPGTFDRSPLGIQCPTLVCTLRKLQEGRRITGPFCWACAQGRCGTRPKACIGLGSRCRTYIYIYILKQMMIEIVGFALIASLTKSILYVGIHFCFFFLLFETISNFSESSSCSI